MKLQLPIVLALTNTNFVSTEGRKYELEANKKKTQYLYLIVKLFVVKNISKLSSLPEKKTTMSNICKYLVYKL